MNNAPSSYPIWKRILGACDEQEALDSQYRVAAGLRIFLAYPFIILPAFFDHSITGHTASHHPLFETIYHTWASAHVLYFLASSTALFASLPRLAPRWIGYARRATVMCVVLEVITTMLYSALIGTEQANPHFLLTILLAAYRMVFPLRYALSACLGLVATAAVLFTVVYYHHDSIGPLIPMYQGATPQIESYITKFSSTAGGMLILFAALNYIRNEQNILSIKLEERTEIALTSRREAEILRAEAESRATSLAELDQQKTDFFQNMSHEIRTPLTLMLLPLERLALDLQDNASIQMAVRNGKRLQRLVNQLLDLQKAEAGKRQSHIATFNIPAFLEASATYFSQAATEKSLTFSLSTGQLGPANNLAQGDIDSMEKIVFNYLSNALKFTPAGGHIELSCHDAPDPAFLRIAVQDTGIGISPEDQQSLFKVFSQVDGSATRAFEGTGLGLALCRNLADSMAGRVGVESKPGEGSLFFLDLPRGSQEDAADSLQDFSVRDWLLADRHAEPETVRPDREQEMTKTEAATILVVDDLDDMRQVIANELKIQGYQVATATDGQRGYDAFLEIAPDLVISDWMMPHLSGPDMIAKIRGHATLSTTPVILLTAKTDDTSRLTGIEQGADAFLGKPFSPRELRSTVNNLLALKSREKELAAVLEELQRTQAKMLENARLATVGHLATGLAHELRNPLNLTQGGAEQLSELVEDLVARSALSPDEEVLFKRCLELVVRGGTRVDAIINRLHQLSENPDGTEREKTDITEVISSIVDFAKLSDESRSVTFETRYDEGLIAPLSSASLSQVLLNLITNALYALNEVGGGQVEVEAQKVDDQGKSRIHIYVRDTGPGIPSHIQATLFEPFVTARAGDTGTGIGLALSRQLIADGGGNLELIESEIGACFLIDLPEVAATTS